MIIKDYDQHEELIQKGASQAMYYSTPTCGVCHACTVLKKDDT